MKCSATHCPDLEIGFPDCARTLPPHPTQHLPHGPSDLRREGGCSSGATARVEPFGELREDAAAPQRALFDRAEDRFLNTPFDPLFLSTKKALANFCVPHVSRGVFD
jgi:hypothetical protein